MRDGGEPALELEAMIASHGGRLRRLLTGVLGDAAGADDVSQDTWFAVWRDRDRLDAGDPWPWIRTVGLRKAIDRMRRRPAEGRAEHIDELAVAPGAAPALDDHLAALTREERAALVLYFWEGLSVLEIADALDAPEGTIKTWMRRGRERLRARILRERRRR